MKIDSRISIEELDENPHLTWSFKRQEERDLRKRLTLLTLLGALLALVLLSGCSTTARRVGSIGAMTDGDNAVIQGRYGTFEKGKIGGFGAIAAGGGEPRGDDFDDGLGPFVPGPDSALSERTGDSFLTLGAQGGITYQPTEHVGLLLGMSVWGEQAYNEYRYDTPFSGSGRYFTEEDVETEVGVVVGVELFNDSGTTLGIQYDSAPGDDGMFGLSVGFEF